MSRQADTAKGETELNIRSYDLSLKIATKAGQMQVIHGAKQPLPNDSLSP